MFAAILSAFLVTTLPLLQSNAANLTFAAILHLSVQLSNLTSPSNTPFTTPDFNVSSNAAVVNGLLFSSLALILVAAFLAMLIKGCIREFDHGMRAITSAETLAKERECRLQSVERWMIPQLVTFLPVLVQVSLALFCAGLVVFLWPIYSAIAYGMLAIFSAALLFYAIITCIPFLDEFSTFSSPFSRQFLWGRAACVAIFRSTAPSMPRRRRRPQSHLSPIFQRLRTIGRLCFRGLNVDESQTAHKWLEHRRSFRYDRSHLSIIDRLATSTVKSFENLPVFLSIFDQSVDPSLQLQRNGDSGVLLGSVLPMITGVYDLSLHNARNILRILCLSYERYPIRSSEGRIARIICDRLEQTDSSPVDAILVHLLRTRMLDWDIDQHPRRWEAAYANIHNLEPDQESLENLLWAVNVATVCPTFPYAPITTGNEYTIQQCLRLLRSILIFAGRIPGNSPVKSQLIHANIQAIERVGSAILRGYRGTKHVIQQRGLFALSKMYPADQVDIGVLSDIFIAARGDEKYSVFRELGIPLLLLVAEIDQNNARTRAAFDLVLGDSDVAYWTSGLNGLWDAHHIDPSFLITAAASIAMGHTGAPPELDLLRYFSIFLLQYDRCTQQQVTRIDKAALEFIQSALTFVQAKFELDPESLMAALEPSNPWLVLHLNNVTGRPATVPAEAIAGMDWTENDACRFIASARLRLYIADTVPPEPALLALFRRSSSYVVRGKLRELAQAQAAQEHSEGTDRPAVPVVGRGHAGLPHVRSMTESEPVNSVPLRRRVDSSSGQPANESAEEHMDPLRVVGAAV